jgi:hypothetical protein
MTFDEIELIFAVPQAYALDDHMPDWYRIRGDTLILQGLLGSLQFVSACQKSPLLFSYSSNSSLVIIKKRSLKKLWK